MIKIDKYAGAIFPSREIDPRDKGSDYCRKNAEAIYALWMSNGTSWGYNSLNEFDTMRAYADGEQSTEQYKSFLLGASTDNNGNNSFVFYDDNDPTTRRARREGWYNMLWQNLSPAGKIMNSLHGMMDKFDFDIHADTIDSTSKGLIEFEKYKKFHIAQEIEFQSQYCKNAGIPFDENTNFPRSQEELDAYSAREGFKLNIAKSMQKLLRHSFNISDWTGTIRKKIVDDLITVGVSSTMDYYDSELKKFRTKWIDPKYTVIQFSNEKDYKDAEYGGYFFKETISNLRRLMPDVTEDEWYEIARANVNRLGNKSIPWGDRASGLLDPTTGSYAYDNYNACVFYACWIDADTYKSLDYTNSHGRKVSRDMGFNDKPTKLTQKQLDKGMTQDVRRTRIRNVHHCNWIVGTKYTYEAGPLHMAARPMPSKPQLPIHAEQLLQPSIIHRLRPILDDIAITMLQHRNSMSKMIERGYAVDMSMLMNITMGGKMLDPVEILEMWKQSGILAYMYPNGRYSGGAALPVTPIDGGMGARVVETANALNMLFGQVAEVVGINSMSTGSAPDPNMPVGTNEAAMQSTTNVLRPIMDSIFELKQSLAESMMLRMQIAIKNSPEIREAYAGVVNPTDIKTLVMAEHNSVQYGITLMPKPDNQKIADIKQMIQFDVQNGILDSVEGSYFLERLESGEDSTEIRQQLAYAIEKGKQRKQQDSLASINAQGQVNNQLEMTKAQNEQAKIITEGKMKMAEETVRGGVKGKQTKLDANIELMKQLYADAALEDNPQIIPNNGSSKR